MMGINERMKIQYENRTRYYLPRRTCTIVRVDGKAFHHILRNAERPYDKEVMATMDRVAETLLEEMQGARFAFVQSDEISVLLTDFDSIKTEAWFDGNLQKIVSISASIASAWWNYHFMGEPAYFDSRAFTIPDPSEVENYFISRQKDAERIG